MKRAEQAIGAAISNGSMQSVERAYNTLRDLIDRALSRPTQPASGAEVPAEATPAMVEAGLLTGSRFGPEAMRNIWRTMHAAAIRALPIPEAGAGSFQDRVQPWMIECFGTEISDDKLERSDRAVEEMLELSQAVCAMIGVDFAPRAHALVDYVAGRPVGEVGQEVGGVMVTLAALCLAVGENMHAAGEAELARISQRHIIQKIRAKQAAKPTGSALPVAQPQQAVEAVALLRDMVRLSEMGFEQSMLEPEENGNFVTFNRAKAFLAGDLSTIALADALRDIPDEIYRHIVDSKDIGHARSRVADLVARLPLYPNPPAPKVEGQG